MSPARSLRIWRESTTLSTFTASIAHEVNQPLSGIVTNASTCLRMLDAHPPNRGGRARNREEDHSRRQSRVGSGHTAARTFQQKKRHIRTFRFE